MGRGGGGGGRRKTAGGGSDKTAEPKEAPSAPAGGGTNLTQEQRDRFGYNEQGQIDPEKIPSLENQRPKYDNPDAKTVWDDRELDKFTPEGWDQLPEGGRGVKEFGKWDYENIHAYSGGAVPGGAERFEGLRSEFLNMSMHSGPELFNTEMRKFLKERHIDITDAELVALRDRYRAWGSDLTESLSKIQDSPGTAYRSMSTPFELAGKKDTVVSDMFQEGQTYRPNALMSTSRKSDIDFRGYDTAKGGYSYQGIDLANITADTKPTMIPAIRIKVEGKTGKNIGNASRFFGEFETLFGPKTEFMVTSKSWDQSKLLWSIEMKEM
jgi:hypothetical protein